MRAVIISEIAGTLKKISWVEEGSGGIYMGFYGAAGKMHLSYHVDGTVHMKAGSECLPMFTTTPIEKIDKFASLHSYGISLTEDYDFATSDYTGSKGANAIVYINPEIIKRNSILNINPYIVRKGAEKDCLLWQQKTYEPLVDNQTFEILNASFFRLDRFSNHFAVIILCGGK